MKPFNLREILFGNRLVCIRIGHGIILFATVIAAVMGCVKKDSATVPTSDSTAPLSPAAKTPLRLIVVDDEPLAAALERQWQAADGGTLEIHNLTSEKLCGRDGSLPPTDLFIYPAALIGELSERDLIVPISDESLSNSTFNRRDVFELVRLRECNWGEKTMAIPLGSPQLMLLYRTDVFERFQLQPPTTWQEYEQVVDALAKVDVAKESGAIAAALTNIALEPTSRGWAGQMLLARSAASARHKNQFSTLFDFSSMEPLIGQAPFVRALEDMSTVLKSRRDAPRLLPEEIREVFIEGKCAMAITWPAGSADRDSRRSLTEVVPASVLPLPGSSDVYNFREMRWEKRDDAESTHVPLLAVSGRLGSVAKDSRRTRAALNLLLLLSGSDWSAKVLPVSVGTTIFRDSHISDVHVWVGNTFEANTAASYGIALQRVQKSPLWLFSPRIPGRAEYLTALDEEVEAALTGNKDAAEALDKVTKRWTAITQQYGQETQRRAYRRCLGLDR